MLQVILRVKVTQIAQWSKLLTSTRFFYGHEFESQMCIIYLFIFFVVVGFLFFSCCFPYQACTLCMILEFLGILKWVTFFLQKNACCQLTFISIVIMAKLLGASENGTKNYVHY